MRATSRALALAVLACRTARTAAHGAVVHPFPRNGVDGLLHPWRDGVPYPVPWEGGHNKPTWCPIAQNGSHAGHGLSGRNGQACFWFSNGCSIGCPTCDGVTRGPIPLRKSGCRGMAPDRDDDNCARKMDVCRGGATATVCDPSLRTYNVDAPCGGPSDYYYYSPWRRPGSAPVLDSCGVAGGRPPPAGGFGTQYFNTSFASQGDRGSAKLPRTPSETVWRAGSVVEVSWAIYANHGGGYMYRLCPASSSLTEECFERTPLPFAGPQALRWGGVGGEVQTINGTFVSAGTHPPGSTWAKNPIPDYGSDRGAPSFPPPCAEIKGCGVSKMQNPCRCSGEWGPFNLEIVDRVRIPADLKPGPWVLGWRWDAEESNQVWASCSDVEVIA